MTSHADISASRKSQRNKGNQSLISTGHLVMLLVKENSLQEIYARKEKEGRPSRVPTSHAGTFLTNGGLTLQTRKYRSAKPISWQHWISVTKQWQMLLL